MSREKLNWAPRVGPERESNRTCTRGLPALLPCAVPGPVCLSVHGAQAGQGQGGGTMQATLYCTVHQTDQIGG